MNTKVLIFLCHGQEEKKYFPLNVSTLQNQVLWHYVQLDCTS
jgi:hypothetical protein